MSCCDRWCEFPEHETLGAKCDAKAIRLRGTKERSGDPREGSELGLDATRLDSTGYSRNIHGDDVTTGERQRLERGETQSFKRRGVQIINL